ncbi:MAG: hypothetical protein AB7V25_13140 [Mangrovibacterium sp.]
MNDIQFQGQLTEKDFKKITSFNSRRLLFIGGVLFIFLINWKGIIYAIKNSPSEIYLHLLPGIFFFIILIIFNQFIIRSEWEKNLIKHRPFKGKISDVGIEWIIENISTTNLPWDFFTKFREHKDIIFVQYGFNDNFVFMKKFFSNEIDWKNLKEILEQKVIK